ncbi:MAG: hypothetical protein GVY23_03245 [Spirochaetes bacterium]|jgi:hypothetical protein|nr:hypothetical protein [Spirochaetota bacterium]
MARRSSNRRRSNKNRGRDKKDNPAKYYMPEPPPKREYPPCPLSGEPIDDPYSAVEDPDTGRPARLDSVIKKLSESERLGPNERIAYIGQGSFGVVEERKENGKKQVVIKKRIEFENGRTVGDWRKELSPGISRDYRPEPEPLSSLYSEEEERKFPRFSRNVG